MKKLLSLLLLCVSIIMPAQAQYTNISNTELFEIRASANVSPNQLERVKWDSDYIYICTATNTWKRVGISNW